MKNKQNGTLTRNKEGYGDIETINISPSELWKPDIVLYNSAEEDLDGALMDQFKTKIILHHSGEEMFVKK